MKNWVHKYLSEEDLKEIQNRISQVEKFTSGEIRLCIRLKRSFKERKADLHDVAIHEFHSLGMHNTKHKTGVLIFIMFGERYFDILADEGIHKKIDEIVWKELEEKMKDEFKKGSYKTAILHVIERIGETLRKEFPHEEGGINELSDEIDIK